MVVKSADKGGAVVVSQSDLYQKEALRQLSDTSLYAKIQKDLTSVNQNLSKRPFRRFLSASVNSFHPALKYTWEISETSLAFLDIKVSISGNVLCTSVYYKPTDSRSCLLYSSSHLSHVKNCIPHSQFLIPRRLCSDDSNFSGKSVMWRSCLSQWSKRATIAPNYLIDSQHYKRHKR